MYNFNSGQNLKETKDSKLSFRRHSIKTADLTRLFSYEILSYRNLHWY